MCGHAALADEQLLLDRAREGDPGATTLLLRRHRSAIERICQRMCRGDEGYEDVLQESYLAILRSLPSFRGDSAFLTWAYTICRTYRGRQLRRRRRDAAVQSAGRRLERVESHRNVIDDAGLGEALERALAPLSQIDRQVLLLRDQQGISAQEAADRLQLTVPAVKTRLFRARTEVRKRLQDYRPVAMSARTL
jgi:RNA polymerase sigma-70 factor (ECF subfamily)